MKIDEAIEVLHEDLGADTYDNHPYLYQAQKLGIEALKRIISGRNPERRYVCYLLPGETTEEEVKS